MPLTTAPTCPCGAGTAAIAQDPITLDISCRLCGRELAYGPVKHNRFSSTSSFESRPRGNRQGIRQARLDGTLPCPKGHYGEYRQRRDRSSGAYCYRCQLDRRNQARADAKALASAAAAKPAVVQADAGPSGRELRRLEQARIREGRVNGTLPCPNGHFNTSRFVGRAGRERAQIYCTKCRTASVLKFRKKMGLLKSA